MKKEIPIKNFYYILSYAWETLSTFNEEFQGNDNFTNTTDLMSKLMEISFNHLIKRGIEKSYVSDEKEIRGIKGRLCLSETIKSGILNYGKTLCEYDEYGFDGPNNRVIKATVKAISKLDDISTNNHRSLLSIMDRLERVSDIDLLTFDFEKIRLNASNRYYRFILSLCKLIASSLTVSSETGQACLSNFIDETLRNESIYEKFIKNFYSKNLKTATVYSPKFNWEISDTSDDIFKERIPELRSDVVIDYPGSRLIIDAKFYAEAIKQNYGKFKYRRDHLSQLMEYIRTSMREKSVPTQGMLLYPTVDTQLNERGKIENLDIKVATIDLSKDWKEIESNMIDLISELNEVKVNVA